MFKALDVPAHVNRSSPCLDVSQEPLYSRVLFVCAPSSRLADLFLPVTFLGETLLELFAPFGADLAQAGGYAGQLNTRAFSAAYARTASHSQMRLV